jgi:hypothetical protein
MKQAKTKIGKVLWNIQIMGTKLWIEFIVLLRFVLSNTPMMSANRCVVKMLNYGFIYKI